MKPITPETQLALWRTEYCELLTQNILPFWLEHGVDREWGGISNVLSDEGSAVSHDKFLWSQGRALWTFSAAHNRVGARPEWLEFADHIFHYLREHGRDDQGRWMYRLDQYGNILDRDISIYVDGFAIAGCTEYFTATRNSTALEIGRATWANVQERLGHPGSCGVAPYEIPMGLKTHGIAMLFSFFGYNLAEVCGEERIRLEALDLANQVLTDFYVPEVDAILEYVTLEGDFSVTPPGRACVPGHALEARFALLLHPFFKRETRLAPREYRQTEAQNRKTDTRFDRGKPRAPGGMGHRGAKGAMRLQFGSKLKTYLAPCGNPRFPGKPTTFRRSRPSWPPMTLSIF